MIVTVFRSRVRPGLRDEYVALANRMTELAKAMPGFVSHKGFFADDGERVAIVEFANEEGQRAWQTNPEHRIAQRLAREKYYLDYHIQVCTLERESKWAADAEAAAVAN
ncbi:MAG TPA: antibiotic biosynthesis monooxygenase [Xanthobacteraceae bacterium]|nr:antibiotic biosynthesis monooxygenase [Xanthobacteraceae bacterium]